MYVIENRKVYKGYILKGYMVEYLECECGAIIKGNSKAHAEELLKIHKTSKRHIEQMRIRNSGEQITLSGGALKGIKK